MFIVPFMFAFYPEMLLIEDAVLDPMVQTGGAYLPGYDGQIHIAALGLLVARIVLALYLISSALAGQDRHRLPAWEVALRLGLAFLVMTSIEAVHFAAAAAAIALIVVHRRKNVEAQAA